MINIGRGLMVVWFLTGLGHVFAPRFTQHNFDVVGGALQMMVAVALFSLMTRAVRRRRAVASPP
jgi:hypothetical protein